MKSKTKLIFVVAILLLVSLACGTESDVVVNTPAANTQNNNQSQPVDEQPSADQEEPPAEPAVEPTPEPTLEPTLAPLGTSRSNPAPVGSEVQVDNMALIVLSSTRPATDIVMAGNMFNTEPEPGQEYMFVELQATCMKSADQECSISPSFTVKLVGSAGVTHEAEWFTTGVDGLLEDTSFFGGATVKGQIPFIVNQDETDLILIYEPLLFGDSAYLLVP